MTELQKQTFGKNVKHLMIDHDMKSRDLAEKIGYKEKMLSKVLNGEKVPPLNMVVAISDVFRINMDALINSNYQ